MQIDLDWLMEVLSIPHPIYNMVAGNINISKYCATVSQTLSSDLVRHLDAMTLASLLDRGELLDLEFSQWYQGLPEPWLPRKVQPPSCETMIVYPDVTSAGVWNYYRGTRIILQHTILEIHRWLSALVGGETGSSSQVPEEIIRSMVGEICQPIPFAMGDVDSLGLSKYRVDRHQTSIKGIEGFALMWPIFGVQQSGHATAAQEMQAREALRRIASTHGIKLGMELSSETLTVNRMISPGSSFGSEVSLGFESVRGSSAE